MKFLESLYNFAVVFWRRTFGRLNPTYLIGYFILGMIILKVAVIPYFSTTLTHDNLLSKFMLVANCVLFPIAYLFERTLFKSIFGQTSVVVFHPFMIIVWGVFKIFEAFIVYMFAFVIAPVSVIGLYVYSWWQEKGLETQGRNITQEAFDQKNNQQ